MRRKGFTLVELLVVIGIIALLIAILMPALSRAREQTQRVSCLSNLRQLGTAMMMYVQDNKGRFPAAGVGVMDEDWIYWHAGRNRDEAPLVRYHGGKFIEKLYRCPSDVIENRRTMTPGLDFSYTINWNIAWYPGRGLPPEIYPPKVTTIVNPSNKILFIDESWETIDDACWAPENWFGDTQNMLSIRHDKQAEKAKNISPDEVLRAGRGNVAFADGHCDYISRKDALDPNFFDPYKR